jgi:hypothetical protein
MNQPFLFEKSETETTYFVCFDGRVHPLKLQRDEFA